MLRWCAFTFLFLTLSAFGQNEQVWLHPNRGQWGPDFNYKVELSSGNLFLDPTGFTYQFFDAGKNHNDEGSTHSVSPKRSHVIKTHFLNAHAPSSISEEKPSSFYRNYFLSNDHRSWKSKVYAVEKVVSHNVYSGIDLAVEGGTASLKYSWIVAPDADPSVVQWSYDGAESVTLNANGELVIRHSLGFITEGKPLAWTLRDGKKHKVDIAYKIDGKTVSFQLEDGPFTDTLVLDPSLTFSTFTGSLADNWGFTAAPDQVGNLFAGGIVMGTSYPLTAGAFDSSFNGGTSGAVNSANDIAITKFNQLGTALLYSTFIGGNGNETPHSLVSGPTGELFMLGVTASSNFPMGGTPFDNSFNGGPGLVNVNEIDFSAGADMFITRLSADGTTMLASTYIGGTGSDGLNMGTLNYNYGDPFRGEIIVSGNNVYVASSTNSTNFPLANAMQSTMNGPQDAVIFKMNLGLSTMLWSTYFGGAGSDSGNGIQLSSTGNVYVAGGTTSSGLPFSSGHDLSYNGGMSDGYLVRLNGTTGAALSGTYIGTNEYDQSYFVQLDLDDGVYVLGQTEGVIPVSPGCYGTANSGQFIAKYSTDLGVQSWTTTVGAGTGHVEISPTAFLVSNCKDIYVSGWGGTVNTGNSQFAIHSTSNGFPVTPDAFQSNTNGSNFWIAVLGKNAQELKYATFMGGTVSSMHHVDGGTSRFDKNGNIYHAVCAACGGIDNGFTTTPGVWSPQNQSLSNCNLAAFKFELSSIHAIVSAPEPLICLPDPVSFTNNSANGNEFLWNFGDNTTSTEINPSHVYTGPGQYTVTLIVTDSNLCFTSDTVQFEVNIGDFQGGIIEPPSSICPGGSYQFEAYGGAVYGWSPIEFLDDPNIFNPTATITENTVFTCIISDSCGIDTVDVLLTVFGGNVIVSNDTSVCIGNSVPLTVQGVASAVWSPPTYLDDPNSMNPVSTPDATITYTVTGVTNDGCELDEEVTITVIFDAPVPVIPDTLTYCEGLSGTVTVSGAESYAWSPPTNITPLTGPTVSISTTTEQYYFCDFTNACGTVQDSVYINIMTADVTAGNDTIVCPGEIAFMWASGGVSYTWSPTVNFLGGDGSAVSVIAPHATTYTVTGIDENGCYDSATVFITLFPQPFIQTCPDVYAFMGEEITLSATSTTPGVYVWSPAEYLSCVTCPSPVANPDQHFVYTVSYVDANGCSASDAVEILYDPIIYVPNTFTPDGDEHNNEFFALGGNIADFRLEIFDRWGELIYTGGALDLAWDGTYIGRPCQDGVYTWKIRYTDLMGKVYDLVGHVSLLR